MKLLRKNILKLIRNLKSGEYRKGTGNLVSVDGKKFCCLGVYADQQGATWDKTNDTYLYDLGTLLPVAKGKVTPQPSQDNAQLQSWLAGGLTEKMQSTLVELNDNFDDWEPVIKYLKEKVLPKAK